MELESWWKPSLLRQFAAAIAMIEKAIRDCPDEIWADSARPPEWHDRDIVGFWYVAYHTIFFLDLYSSESATGFQPPPPFTADEMSPEGLLPHQPYTKDELLDYLGATRRKLADRVGQLTEQSVLLPCGFSWLKMNVAELQLYNLRHVQHHAGQLYLVLRQQAGAAPRWVSVAPIDGSLPE
ncbi:DinB family protein [uncultured Paludibaculum sp.]|uniref:DinB family protein n=1 Tax=uncultured Paludibaculum sp. TaxID=1765020 RepID=UPI002AAB01C0|nr:DinB family protein [uncultured Paludibaculum sp.]